MSDHGPVRIRSILVAVSIVLLLSLAHHAQTKITEKASRLNIHHLPKDFSLNDLNNISWNAADDITIRTYWSGAKAPAGRHFKARLLWSDKALYIRFEAAQTEPLTISKKPDLANKTKGLWDRDVCEIFIAPNRSEPRKYFEFEIAPTREWIDLAIDLTSGARITDWDYSSDMKTAAKIEADRVIMAISIPWSAFGTKPKDGDVWLGNLFRCVGDGPDRGYLAWKPTLTAEPSFHVPSAFGELVFLRM